MSGRKESEYRLQREREEKLQLLRKLTSLGSEVAGLRERVAEALEEASEGLLSTFADEVERAERWLRELRMPDAARLDVDSDRGAIDGAVSESDRAAQQGRRIQQTLVTAPTRKAGELGQRLAGRLAEVEQRWIGSRELLRLWLDTQKSDGLQSRLQSARQMLAQEQYATLEPALEELDRELVRLGQLADEQEGKHQKRLYLLKGLRQVCANMGFKLESDPKYEKEGDRGSRIVMKVDTLNRGPITFWLSLDDISSHSNIDEGDTCYDQFDELSDKLEQQFGIQTGFEVPGKTRPKRRYKGTMELPHGKTRTQQRSG